MLSKRANKRYTLSETAKTINSRLKVLVYKSLVRNTGMETVLANNPIRHMTMDTTPVNVGSNAAQLASLVKETVVTS